MLQVLKLPISQHDYISLNCDINFALRMSVNQAIHLSNTPRPSTIKNKYK